MKSPLSHLIIVLILCVAALVGYWFWYGIVVAQSVAIANIESQISSKIETTNRIASARAVLDEIAENETRVQSYFVPEIGVVPFIDALEAIGRSHGTAVTVSSVAINGTGMNTTLTLAVNIKGTFDALMRTVGTIEYVPNDLSISALSLAQDSKDNWHADLKLSIGALPKVALTTSPKSP